MINDVCNTVGLSYGTCQQILSDELNMRCTAAKFVPRLLGNDQKEYHIAVCTELKEQAENFGLFFDNEGIVHKEFVPPAETVNGKFYSDALTRKRENIQHQCTDKWHNNSWALRHDNARLTFHFLCCSYWASMKMTVIHYLPYSPDFAPCDFFPIPEDKIETQGVTF